MARRASWPRSGRGTLIPPPLHPTDRLTRRRDADFHHRHRWDSDIKEWVKMSATEEKLAKEFAQRRKKADMDARNHQQ